MKTDSWEQLQPGSPETVAGQARVLVDRLRKMAPVEWDAETQESLESTRVAVRWTLQRLRYGGRRRRLHGALRHRLRQAERALTSELVRRLSLQQLAQ